MSSTGQLFQWERHGEVTVVECPKCAFCFDADHEDEGGGYSCPACAEIGLREENARLRLQLRLPGPNPPEGYFDV